MKALRWHLRFLVCCVSVFLLLPPFPTASAQGSGQGRGHGFSDALFSVLIDGRPTSQYVLLTVRVETPGPGSCTVDAQAAFLSEDPGAEQTRITLRTFSTRDTSITRAKMSGDTLTFDLLLDGRDADRTMRIRSILDQETGAHRIKASGLWSDQTHTSFMRAQWTPKESILLRYPLLVSPGRP